METDVNSTATVTTRSVGIRFGLVGALISIAYFLVLNTAGIDMSKGVWNWVGYLITLALLVLAHKSYKDRGDGFMSYGQGMGIAFWVGLVSSVISAVFTFLYIKFIDTSFIELVRDRQIEAMQQQGMTDQQIDQAMKVAAAFTTPEAMFGFMLVGGIAITLIIGLIVSIFTQKKNPEPAF